jgi:hypothetical protein
MIGIICHDAGGAEILSSYVLVRNLECSFILEGPAVAIFEKKLGPIPIISLDIALIKCSEFICGTSWQSDLEWRAIKEAKIIKKPIYCFLDHWCNYKERFNKNGVEELPNEIWVDNIQAKNIVLRTFPYTTVKLLENPYFEDIKDNIKKLEEKNPSITPKGRILFVCEPVSEHAKKEYNNPLHWGYTEFTALDYFFKNIDVIEKNISSITIRPHPSEINGKYDYLLKRYQHPIVIGGDNTLLEELLKNDIIVGCGSMAMIIGLITKRRVISVIPPEGQDCVLPHLEIEHLKSLIN